MKKAFLTLLIWCIGSYTIYAQDPQLQRRHAKRETAPSAILVQLSSESNRLSYFTKINDVKNLKRVEADAAKIRQVMVNDFADHFKFCPVYFYIDTNVNKVISKHFAGVLFSADGSAVNDPSLMDYVIVYYGKPEDNKKGYIMGTSESDTQYGMGYVMGNGLIVCNDSMVQYSNPFPYYTYSLGDIGKIIRKRYPKYAYASRKFDMEYFPLARRLSRSFSSFFRNQVASSR